MEMEEQGEEMDEEKQKVVYEAIKTNFKLKCKYYNKVLCCFTHLRSLVERHLPVLSLSDLVKSIPKNEKARTL